ncbi:MAG: hypothetical protein ACI8XM_002595 [Haloarculaceae archaeon]|jgi:hypothetical protein
MRETCLYTIMLTGQRLQTGVSDGDSTGERVERDPPSRSRF